MHLSTFATLASLALLGALAGCGSATPATNAETGANGLTGEPSPQCSAKACGVDCTPAGSDEPFNCNASGRCVATGQPLGCKAACPAFLGDCAAGTTAADRDGDGCVDGCAPFVPVYGRVLFPKGWAPPPGKTAVGVVELLDVTQVDAPSITVARAAVSAKGDAPREYRIQVTASIVQNRTYVVRAHIDTDGNAAVSKGDLVTTESYPVLTGGHGGSVDVTVHPVL